MGPYFFWPWFYGQPFIFHLQAYNVERETVGIASLAYRPTNRFVGPRRGLAGCSSFVIPTVENSAKPGTGQGGEHQRDRVPVRAQVHHGDRGNRTGQTQRQPYHP